MTYTKTRVGRFSETYPPERQCVRFCDWPTADRIAFESARRTGDDAFELSGPAASWACGTARKRQEQYGRYLNFLKRRGLLLDIEGPVDRFTRERVIEYMAEMKGLVSLATLDQSLLELNRVISAMVPDRDWSWIRQLPGRPTARAIRASMKPKKTFDAKKLCCDALDLMDQISAGVSTHEISILYRNALIVAMQCIFALRRQNLADMTLGNHLIVGDGVIHLIYGSEETKNYAPIKCTIPEFLKPYLFLYLSHYRPILLAGRQLDAVWISGRHGALDYGAFVTLFNSIGPRLLGESISCHSFRHSAATTILTKDPRKLRTASGVLSHGSRRTVNQHYDMSGDEGSRKVWDRVRRDIVRGKGLYKR